MIADSDCKAYVDEDDTAYGQGDIHLDKSIFEGNQSADEGADGVEFIQMDYLGQNKYDNHNS